MKKVNKYRDLNPGDVVVGAPEKQNGRYISPIKVNGRDFYMQSPSGLEISRDGKTTFTLVKKGEFFNKLEDTSNAICEAIADNSEKFFKGKKFSKEYVVNATDKIVDLDNEGLGFLNNTRISPDCKVYDHLNDLISKSEVTFPVYGTVILHFKSVEFVKKSIRINIEIASMKTSLEKKKLDECILEDETEGGVEDETEGGVEDEIEGGAEQVNEEQHLQPLKTEEIANFEPVSLETPLIESEKQELDLDVEVAKDDPLDVVISEDVDDAVSTTSVSTVKGNTVGDEKEQPEEIEISLGNASVSNVTGKLVINGHGPDNGSAHENPKSTTAVPPRPKTPESFFDDAFSVIGDPGSNEEMDSSLDE